MRDSKALVMKLHEFGVTCSYDEVLQFKKSAAVAATENANLRGVSDSRPAMIQTVVDNFDADISSQNGKVSTHSLAVLMTQTVETNSSASSCETIKRLPRSEMTESVDYKLEIEHYRGVKKPEMPVEKSKRLVPSLKLLASMEISLKRANKTDLAFAQDLIKSDQCPEFNGYNT